VANHSDSRIANDFEYLAFLRRLPRLSRLDEIRDVLAMDGIVGSLASCGTSTS
jgi:hypothetical protein